MSTVITILVAVLIFGVLIISHEFGHFITARLCGVTVEEFSIGMGPLITQKEKKNTLFSIRALPVGGYCKMKGEDEDDGEEGCFCSVSPFKRILILMSGAIMNFIVAVLIFFILMCITGTTATTQISTFSDNSPAFNAGIEKGDTIISINEDKITQWSDVSQAVNSYGGSQCVVTVQKNDGSEKTYIITPSYDETSGNYMLGISPKVKFEFLKALANSFVILWEYIVAIFNVFINLFRGKIGIEAFSGPIGAAVVIGQYIPQGIIYVLAIAASISVSLGFFNLLPIPALDGSHILFTLIEWIKGSPINRKAESTIHFIGFAALMLFAVFIAYRDIITFF